MREQIEVIQKEVGLFSGSPFIENALTQIDLLAANSKATADIFLSAAARVLVDENCLKQLSDLDVEIFSTDSQLGCVTGLRKAVSAVFVCLEEEVPAALNQQPIWSFFESHATDYIKCRVLVIGNASEDRNAFQGIQNFDANLMEVIKIECLQNLVTGFSDLSTAALMRQTEMFKIAAAAPVVDRIKNLVASELSSLTLRRQIIASEQERSRRSEQTRDGDVQSSIRSVLQKNFQDTDRLFRQKYEELCRQNVGSLAKLIDTHAESMSGDHIIKVDKAANFEKYEAQIDPNFLNAGVDKLRRGFALEINKDRTYINNLSTETEASVENILRQSGIENASLGSMVKPHLEMEKMDQSHFFISKTYKGELTKPGVMEYFGALRDYTGLIMVIIGILAPLTMLATAPDADPGSMLGFINSISKELKDVRAYIQFFSIVLIFGMLIYGVFDLRKRIPNKRKQELENEILQARDFTKEQLTRLLNEAHRDWTAVLSQYVKDYSQALQTEADLLVKKRMSGIAEIAAERRRLSQLEQVSVEHKLKTFTGVERSLESFYRRFQDTLDRTLASVKGKAGTIS